VIISLHFEAEVCAGCLIKTVGNIRTVYTPCEWITLLGQFLLDLDDGKVYFGWLHELGDVFTLRHLLLPYGYSYKASCVTPGYAVICNF